MQHTENKRQSVTEIAKTGTHLFRVEQAMVRDFHVNRLGCQDLPQRPELCTEEQFFFNLACIREELEEIEQAGFSGDLAEIADGIGDAMYYLLGFATRLGISIGPVFMEIHLANMEKEHDPTGADGGKKVRKQPGWKEPRIKEILEQQGYKGD